MRVRFVSVDGERTRTIESGAGFPVLLLHGLGTMAERWMHNLDALGERFRAIAPDLRNNGFSDDFRDPDEAPQLAHVRQMSRLLDALDLDECAVVGSSYGGLVAGLLALQAPARVRRLVIVGSGSALHPPQLQQQVLRAVKANAMKAIDGGTLDDCRARLCATSFEGRSVNEAMLPGLLTSNALPGRRESAARFYDALIENAVRDDCQTWPRLEAIAVPTLIVTGRDDIRASWQQAVQAATRIPDCRIEIFEACGHGPMAEHPERFNRLLHQFLQPLAGRADALRAAPHSLH